MSNYTILQDISVELRRRIHSMLLATPDANFGLTTPETDIVLDPPPNPNSGAPFLSLFLYHIEPDPHLRNQQRLPVGNTQLRYPPLALQLYYLITPLDTDQTQNQLLLGRILQHFHDKPFLSELNGTPLDNSFGGNSPEMRITMETLTLEDLSRVWHALSTSYQLSVAYKVRVVTVDSAETETEAKRTRQVFAAVGPMQP